MLDATASGDARRRRGLLGPDQREQAALERALVQLDVVADLEAADHVEQRLQRDALGVEQQLARRCSPDRRRRRGCAGRRASCPCASGTPRSSPRPGAASSSSLVTWPLRNSTAPAPLSASLPRSERSNRPQPSRSARCSASSVSVVGRWPLPSRIAALGLRADGPRRHLPADRRLAARRLDRPRARPADRRRVALRRSSALPVTCNARPYSHHDWHWRLLVAHRFGHAASAPTVHGALRLLDDAGIEGELVVREMRSGRVEITQMWGRPQSAREEFRRLRAQ